MTAIVTASWFTPLPEGHVRVGISRGVPRRGLQAGFRLYRKLAPGAWFNDGLDPTEWEARYRTEVLDRLDPRVVQDEIMQRAGDQIPVLCCFERVGGGQWCHRALAAAWLAEGLGVAVPEIGHEDQPLHPLRPPTTLL
jgi:hypothetical protein